MKHDYKKILLWTLVCTLILSFTNYSTAFSESNYLVAENDIEQTEGIKTDNDNVEENSMDDKAGDHNPTEPLEDENQNPVDDDSVEEPDMDENNTVLEKEETDNNPDVNLLLEGEGTEEFPYLVSNFKDLKDAFNSTSNKEDNLHIKFIDDIGLEKEYIDIKSNLVIDGNGKTMYRDFKTDRMVIRTGNNDITVVVKNLSHGSEEYGKNSNWYGFISIVNTNVTLILEDFNYDSDYGSQPFYANKADAKLILRGDNHFNQYADALGGEFVERFESVVVEDGTTTIMNYGKGNEYSNFKNVNSIRVNKDATLYVETNRRDFADSTTPIILEENANFKFVSAYTGTIAYLRIGDVTLARDAKFEIQVGGGKIDSSSIDFTVDNPDYILLSHQDESKTPLSGKNKWTITQSDTSEQYYYGISKTENGIQTDSIDYGESGVFESINSIAQVKPEIKATFDSAIYTKVPIIGDSNTEVEVGPGVSDLETELDIPVIGDKLNKIDYKISKQSLVIDGDLNSEASQNNIIMVDDEAIIIAKEMNLGIEDVFINNHIPAGTYYLYIRFSDTPPIAGFDFDNKWIEKVVVVEAYENIEVIYDEIDTTFTLPGEGAFSNQDKASSISFINHGNTDTLVSIEDIEEMVGSAPSIELVDELPNSKLHQIPRAKQATIASNSKLLKQVTDGWLVLKLTNRETGESLPLSKYTGSNKEDRQFSLKPFWHDGVNTAESHTQEFYLTGEYKGFTNETREVGYNVNYSYESIK